MLLNQTWFCSPHIQQCPSTDAGLWWRKVQCLLPGTQQGRGGKASDPLPLGLWAFFFLFFFFNQRRSTKAGISHCLWHFLIVIWESGCLEFSGQVAHGSGVCELFLSWRNNLSVYFHEEIYTNSFSTLTMLLARAILATWLWLISVQLVHDCRWHHWQRICLPMQET